ncbi:type IV pilus assembly PilZ [Candidatus Koribacter versatilis Ellin345]|uniref:Type IV pilus assembly PilZ n=1 Tax=Koribacter versatilis (strain Ellin345) TaxID=204669 RepID=Q1IKW4_KORVE|nr:PilZ domain-containing protein [Candidatus Koribacter versatilis]ABF42486.1 type IV pilus assembly PilZ [Candidatus Koribacter versatilis Ellin345]
MHNPTRKEPRTAAVLPVRIYGMDASGKPFNAVAHTLNVSKSGGLLAGVEVALVAGDLIGVQKGVYKSKFRVRWIGRKGSTSQGQIGIECVEGPRNIWGVDDRPHKENLEPSAALKRNNYSPTTVTGNIERRIAPRHPCDLGIQISHAGSTVKSWARCTDISPGGCYIDTHSPLPPNTNFELTIFLDESMLIPALVRTSFPGIGMGIEFAFANADDAERLSRLIREKILAPSTVEPERTDLPALEKLAEALEQLRTWAAAATLQKSDRDQLEQFANSLRDDLIGLRAEFDARLGTTEVKVER